MKHRSTDRSLRPGGPSRVALLGVGMLMVGAIALGGARCNRAVGPSILMPLHGQFLDDPEIAVHGQLLDLDALTTTIGLAGDLLVPDAGGSYDGQQGVDPDRIFQPIVVRALDAASGDPIRVRRVTTLRGQALPTGAASPGALALRLSDSGLDAIEQFAADGLAVAIDIEDQILDANPIAEEDFCVVPNPFGGCLEDVDIDVDVESVTFETVKLDLDARKDFLRVDAIVKHLKVDYDTDGVDCQGRIEAQKVTVRGDYVLAPDAADPTRLDANLKNPSLSVIFTDFDHDFTGGVCDFPGVGDLIDEIIGNVEPEVETALRKALKDPDGMSGPEDSLVAEAIEDTMDLSDVWGPVGESLGVSLVTTLTEVVQDRQGLTFVFDGAAGTDPEGCDTEGGPVLAGSLLGPEPLLLDEDLTPGGADYGAAIAISTTTLNQLLAARTTCGLLRTQIDTLDLGAGPSPLKAGTLALAIPELADLDPDLELRIELRPSLAPAWNGGAGPGGEAADLRIGHLRVLLVRVDTGGWLVDLALDFRAGLAVSFDGATGDLEFGLGTVPTDAVSLTVLRDRLGVDEASLEFALSQLLPLLLPSLGIDLGPFALPDLLGLPLEGVEATGRPGSLGLYLAIGSAEP